MGEKNFRKWDDIMIKGDIGSEGGEVLADEEYDRSCRMTLEKLSGGGYAITCGIYGCMVHTAFCGGDHMNIYNKMKSELERYFESDLTDDERYEFYDRFTSEF